MRQLALTNQHITIFSDDIVDPTDGGFRLAAMAALLAEKNWSWDDVQRRLVSNMIALDRNGWQIVNGKLMDTVVSNIPGNIQRLVGLEINKKDFGLKVLVERPSPLNVFNRQTALLTWGDIAAGLSFSQAGAFFSLEAINPQKTLCHPFNELTYSPEQLEGTEMLFTMLHTGYLLTQFSMGYEIQSYPPFQTRPVSEGLLKNLPDDLKAALSSIPSRGAMPNRVCRFRIQADTMELDVKETDDTVRWLFGEVKIAVRCNSMVSPDSPESRFAEDFTTHYEKIGKHFPEFLRLKELCKVVRLGKIIDKFKDYTETHKKRIESGELDSVLIQRIQHSTSKISDNAKDIAREKATYLNQIRKKTVEQKEKRLRKFTSVIADLRKTSTKFFLPSNKCKWIPTVNYRQVKGEFIRPHYGSVLLAPKIVKSNLSTPRFFSGICEIALTPALLSNCAPKMQPPPPTFNPPIVNETKPSTGTRQISSNTRNIQASEKGNSYQCN